MKNLAIKIVDRLFLVAYGPDAPTDREWADYLHMVERQGIDRTQQIVSTEGGAPTAAQRRQLAILLDGRAVPVAVVSGSARVRTTVTAISWFNRRIRAFPSTRAGLRDALAYLDIPMSRTELIERELDKLRAEVAEGREAGAVERAVGVRRRTR
jgi:hypothetical protein